MKNLGASRSLKHPFPALILVIVPVIEFDHFLSMFSNEVSLILFPALLDACWLGDVPLNSLSSFSLDSQTLHFKFYGISDNS